MKTIFEIFCSLFFICCVCPAGAESKYLDVDISSEVLSNYCRLGPTSDACSGYIMGLLSGTRQGFIGGIIVSTRSEMKGRIDNTVADKTADKFMPFCIPKTVTITQIGKMFVSYMNKHLQSLHYTASSNLIVMLSEQFPC